MEDEKKKPNTWLSGNIKIVEWINKNDKGIEFKSYEVVKIYTNEMGEWKTTSSFNYNDLLKVARVINRFDNFKNKLEPNTPKQ